MMTVKTRPIPANEAHHPGHPGPGWWGSSLLGLQPPGLLILLQDAVVYGDYSSQLSPVQLVYVPVWLILFLHPEWVDQTRYKIKDSALITWLSLASCTKKVIYFKTLFEILNISPFFGQLWAILSLNTQVLKTFLRAPTTSHRKERNQSLNWHIIKVNH